MSHTLADYPVGFGRPPKAHQFTKGHSGNPKGRPKGSRNISTLLREELDRKVSVTVDGLTKTMSKRQVAVRQQVDKAVKGCPKAFHTLLKIEADGAHSPLEESKTHRPSEIQPSSYDEIISAYVADIVSSSNDGDAS
ncbi:hypothetical protein GCM10009093_27290 [Brevundimonas terrae]|uniref:DUF5681 domain-containing protein n=1 Tax=Brevundimonas terrae TaxID=363631 RepID=A0ABP3IF94_9CAUL|nr:DUF5681 domain-containing protein [Brevundimonas terrae]NIJ27306.1 hypothetical protein [Brevundimonas terrae]